MAQGDRHVTVSKFRGVNLTDPDYGIDDREFADCKNLIVDDVGGLVRRPPVRVYKAPVQLPAGTEISVVLGVWFNRLVFCQGGGGTNYLQLSAVNTTVSTGFKTQSIAQFPYCGILYNKVMYLFHSAGMLRETVSDWTVDNPTITETNFPSAPTAIVKAIVYKDRVFGIQGLSNQNSRIFYSNIADPTVWTGQFFDVNPGDGDYITDIIAFQERIFVFKQYATYVVTAVGPVASWTTKLFDDTVGAVGTDCVVENRGLIYVLSPKGLQRTDGVIYDYVGYPVQDRWKGRVPINPSPNDLIGGSFICKLDENIVIFPANDSIGRWIYNAVQSSWTELTNYQFNNQIFTHGVQGTLKSGQRKTWFGISQYVQSDTPLTPTNALCGGIYWFDLTDPTNPTNTYFVDQVCNAPSLSYTTSIIPTSFKTKRFDSGSFIRIKRHKFSMLELEVITPDLNVIADFTTRYYYDRNGVSDPYYFINLPLERGNQNYRIPGFGRHRRLQLEFTSSQRLDYTVSAIDLVFSQERVQAEINQ